MTIKMSVGGNVANTIAAKAEAGNLVSVGANATLRHEEFVMFSDAIVDVTRSAGSVVSELISRFGLGIPGNIGITDAAYETQSDVDNVQVVMNPVDASEKQKQVFGERHVPVPMFIGNFDINMRKLTASRNRGEPIDVSTAKALTRNIYIENNRVLAMGAPTLNTEVELKGLINNDYKVDVTTTSTELDYLDGTDTTTAIATQANAIRDLFMSGVDSLKQNFFRGPYVILHGTDITIPLARYYSDQYPDKTIKDSLMDIPMVVDVMEFDELPARTAVILQVTEDVIDFYVGHDTALAEMDTNQFNTEFAVFNAIAPRIKGNYKDQTGIAVID